MTTHLLSLADLHSAAPGVLDVVFGADGDFPGAPRFTGPVWSQRWGRYFMLWNVSHDLDGAPRCWIQSLDVSAEPNDDRVDHLALDLRVPVVAARLAGLCVEALGARADFAFMTATGTPDHGFIALRCSFGLMTDRRWSWNRGTGAELSEQPTGVRLPSRCDEASALAALVLSLAPRIAALRRIP